MKALAALTCCALLSCGGCALKRACGDGSGATPDTPTDAGFFPYGHAHNDYEHDRPLFDALDHHFYSVEADIYLRDADLSVSHDGLSSKGTLKALYLDPLAARVVANAGSVYGDGVPFTLWIDLKQGGADFENALAAQLSAQSAMLTRFDDAAATPGAITVVLTGNDGAKRALAARAAPRFWTRDSNDYSPDDPPADTRWSYYALDYTSYVSWDGDGEPPADALERIRCLSATAHAHGRKLRLWNSPDRRGYWKVALDNGVDFINTDDLAGLESFLAAP